MKPADPEVARASRAGAGERRALVARLKAAGLCRDARVAQAMAAVPRHLFVPSALLGEAYGDHALPIGYGQTITQAANVARAAEMAALTPASRVLEVGTGSGYQTVLLSHLVAQVFTIERIPALYTMAREAINRAGATNVSMLLGDGTVGWREYSPYDAILVSAGGPTIPNALVEQLSDGGRMIVPIGSKDEQMLKLITKRNGAIETRDILPVRFVPLFGTQGWEQT